MARTNPVDAASQCLRLALPLMSRHGVPATPENYAVWYAYVARTHPGLVAAIDEREGAGKPADEPFTAELYGRFLAPVDEDHIAAAQASLQSLILGVSDSVESADGEVTRYEENLASHARELDAKPDAAGLGALVAKIADDTRRVREHGALLRARLEDSRQEVELLRAELDRTREEATTDPLTSLANRKAFDQALGEMTAVGTQSPPCMLMLDIDHFKRVNDRFGHLVGDKVIQYVARTLRDGVKGRDVVARFGGEEFAVLLPGTPFRGAMAVAENLRAAVCAERLVRVDTKEPIGSVAVSVGVAAWRPGESGEDLVGRADEALYRAKQGGRNRVEPETALAGTGTDG